MLILLGPYRDSKLAVQCKRCCKGSRHKIPKLKPVTSRQNIPSRLSLSARTPKASLQDSAVQCKIEKTPIEYTTDVQSSSDDSSSSSDFEEPDLFNKIKSYVKSLLLEMINQKEKELLEERERISTNEYDSLSDSHSNEKICQQPIRSSTPEEPRREDTHQLLNSYFDAQDGICCTAPLIEIHN